MRVKDPSAYLPSTVPFRLQEDDEDPSKIVAREILNDNGSLNESDLFLIQFPRLIPINSESQKKLKEEETENDEPVVENGFLVKNDYVNVLKELPKNSQMGKLKIFKSGKIKLQLGDNLFDVSAGVNCKFAQELGVISTKSQESFFLGKIREKKLIVTPELKIQ
jgi:DNA-directed RNA polymerase III subunit RPC4